MAVSAMAGPARQPGVAVLADVPMGFILVGITAYTVFSGADFGAGFWTLIPGGGRADAATTRDHTRHAIGPVWEANHVWLIFVLTVCWTCYPVAFGSIVSTLAVPLLIAAIGIIFRGTAYALRGQLERAEARATGWWKACSAVSSVLTPFALATVVGAIATGRVPSATPRGPGYLLAEPGLPARRGARDRVLRVSRGRLPRGGRPPPGRGDPGGRLQDPGSGRRGRRRRAGPRRPAVVRAYARPLWNGLASGLGLAIVCACALAAS